MSGLFACPQFFQSLFVGVFIKLHGTNKIVGRLNDDLLEAFLIKPFEAAVHTNLRRVKFLSYLDDGFHQRADIGSVAGQGDIVTWR